MPTERDIEIAIENIRNRTGEETFTTKDVIKEMYGTYKVNNGNSAIGRKIKSLGYTYIKSISIKDADGKDTTTAVFEFKNID